MNKKITALILFIVIFIIAATAIVITNKPQMHKTFVLQKIIIKNEAAK